MAKEKTFLQGIPKVEVLVEDILSAGSAQSYARSQILHAVREVLEEVRSTALVEKKGVPAREEILLRSLNRLQEKYDPGVCRVINGTGIILHTGLGRCVLPRRAMEALKNHGSSYCLLAVNREEGTRRKRDHFVARLLCELTGAEDAMVVNNNAAATLLVLNTFAEGKEVICSRGQLVEIGGSFRLPEIVRKSGAKLVTVGTTNKTHLRDYRDGITEKTGVFMRVHNSNYEIQGFTAQVPLREMVALGRETRIPVVDDLGSGALTDLKFFGLDNEPLVAESILVGADVVIFSADKLVGGSQGGIILGSKAILKRLRENPLARTARTGKLDLIALEETLKLFFDRDWLAREHPTYRMLVMTVEELERRTCAMKDSLEKKLPNASFSVEPEYSYLGGGSLPNRSLPTRVLALSCPGKNPAVLAHSLRMQPLPIFTRIKRDQILIDFRTVQEEEETELRDLLLRVLS